MIESARETDKFANFSEDHHFLKATIRFGSQRLHFVVALHHIGRELVGIVEATAFARIEPWDDENVGEDAPSSWFICSGEEPFVVSHGTRYDDVEASFTQWMDRVTAIAIKEFGDRL